MRGRTAWPISRNASRTGEGDFGSCISKKANEQSYWSLLSIAGSFLQSKGTSQGIFFNTKTMAPLVNNAAFKKALQIYKQTNLFCICCWLVQCEELDVLNV